jgi:hypothetical protein
MHWGDGSGTTEEREQLGGGIVINGVVEVGRARSGDVVVKRETLEPPRWNPRNDRRGEGEAWRGGLPYADAMRAGECKGSGAEEAPSRQTATAQREVN